MDTKRALARNLRACMEKAKATQMALAAKSGVTQSTISRMLKAAVAVDVDTLDKVARGLDLHAWQLLIPDMDPSSPPTLQALSAKERELYERMKAAAIDLAKLR